MNDLLDAFIEGSKELSALGNKLHDQIDHLFVFMKYEDVDTTNNLAERDLRRVVLLRKKSYGTRSERGQRYVERIGSVVGTLRKSGLSIFDFLTKTV